jgi:hypothetical protein
MPDEGVEGPTVLVGPVSLPEHLERHEIVVRSEGHQLHLLDYDRWAESLEEGFTRTLVQDLCAGLPSRSVAEHPWEVQGQAAYRVSVSVLRFDADANGVVRLHARWAVADARDSASQRVRYSALERAADVDDVPAVVRTMSELIAELANGIAVDLRAAEEG